jgi:rifampicin phosphotransferase
MTDDTRTDQPAGAMTPTFTPPGPGAWQRDTDHQASTRSPLLGAFFTDAFTEGSRTAFARYGLPLDRLQGADLHGWFFFRPVPAGVPDRGGPPPPVPILRVLTRLVPELRRRERTARTALAERRWLTDARAWEAERPVWAARIHDLLTPDLTEMPDADLATHARRTTAAATELAHRHFSLLGVSIGVGRLLAAAPGLGLGPDEAMAVLRGGAPETASSAAPLAELASIAICAGAVPASAAGLRALSARAAELVDGYLRVYGWRPLGNDPESVTLAEHPDQLAELVRASVARRSDGSASALTAVRDRVPVEDRDRFDALLADARTCYGAADDNSAMLGWAMGALRRVALEVGRRGAGRGDLDVVGDVFLLTRDELVIAAGGTPPITVDAVRRRRAKRIAAERADVPLVIGATPPPPPPAGAFPPAMAAMAEAVGTYLMMKFSPPGPGDSTAGTASLTVDGSTVARGVGVVAGSATGRVVVTADPQDALLRVEPGDILVCLYTSAAWNALFPILGGVVTRFGGPLGHTGVMAREFGIPCMTGIGELPLDADGHSGTLDVRIEPRDA